MIALAALASLSVWALAAGLVTGMPELRTGGLAGVLLFGAAAYLVDRFTKPRQQGWADHLEESDWLWPEREGERRVA